MVKRVATLFPRLLGSFFDLLYTRLAFLYDTVAWLSSMGQWPQWRSTALVPFEPGVILELGHGPGHLLLDLKRGGYLAMGVDPSRQMNRLALRRLWRKGFSAPIVCARAQALPFRQGTISSVISTFPSNYIIDPVTLAEIYRVLSAGGKLIIVGIIEITGKSIPDRFAHWLYAITGQSGSTPTGWEAYLLEKGFEARLEEVNLRRSRVTRIVATRRREQAVTRITRE